jgi:hypothetical protein
VITVARTDWAMAQQIHATGSIKVPSGTYDITTVISGGPRSTTKVDAGVSGPATRSLDVEHFAIRGASVLDANVNVQVRKSDGTIMSTFVDNGRVAKRPDIGLAKVGLHHAPHIYASATTLNLGPPRIQCVRFGIAFSTFMPTNATPDPAQVALYDAVFADLRVRGIKAIVTCGTTPAWSRSGGTLLSPATNPVDHANFVAYVVARWGDSIICVDPWNEPNLTTFFTGTKAQYVALLAAVKTAVRAVNPNMSVSVGPLSLNDYPWLDSLFSNGLTGAMFDNLDVHPYPYSYQLDAGGHIIDPTAMPAYAELDGSVIGGIHKMESVLASHGVTGKTLCVSEVGVSTDLVDASTPNQRMTGEGAAALIATIVDQLRRIPHMKAIAVHQIKDTDSVQTWASTFACLDAANNRRPLWNTMASILA